MSTHTTLSGSNASPISESCLGMDCVSYTLFDGRRLRLLTVIDLYTRECLGICVGQNLRSTEVAEMLNTIALITSFTPIAENR